MDPQQLLHDAIRHFSHTVRLRVVCRGELQSCAVRLHQFLPEFRYEPLVPVRRDRQR